MGPWRMSRGEVSTISESSHATGDARVRSPLYALQALRFLAAAMVLVHHAGYDTDTLAKVYRATDGDFVAASRSSIR